MTNTYFVGDEITVEEMPQGCVIGSVYDCEVVVVSSLADAILLRDSLNKLIEHLINHKIVKQP